MAFRCEGSPLQEMQRMETLRQQDPQSAVNVVANGKLLVEWARDGRLREIHCALQLMDEDRVLLFYSVRMFRVACLARRLDVLRFMLANGFNLQQTIMRDVLHSVVESIEDEQSADSAQSLVRFLLESGVDVNWQRKGDLYTALHLACSKNLYGIAYLLVLYDADVNAIAAEDEMPLQSAERMKMLGRSPTPEDRSQNRLLLDLLADCGARHTWRKKAPEPAAPVQPQPRVVSFSSATARCSFSRLAISSPVSGAEELLVQAFREGIQLDTPEAA